MSGIDTVIVTEEKILKISELCMEILRRKLNTEGLFHDQLDRDFFTQAVKMMLEFSYDVEQKEIKTWIERMLSEYERVTSTFGKPWETIAKINKHYRKRIIRVEDRTIGEIVVEIGRVIGEVTGRVPKYNEEFRGFEFTLVHFLEFLGIELVGYEHQSWDRYFSSHSLEKASKK